jgi:glycerophosphoryl diester phosphodiesterase
MIFKKWALLIYVLLIVGCEKIDIGSIQNLNGGKIAVIGHGGAGFQSAFNELPENSLSSVQRAVEIYGADGIELDIQLTKDSQLVAYHDNRLETSTNGYGFIHDFTLSELKKVTYNNEFYASLFLDERITSLEEILTYLSARRIKAELHIDLRTQLFDSTKYSQIEFISLYIKEVIDLIKSYNYQSYTFIGSSAKFALSEALKLAPDVRLLYETENVIRDIDYLKKNKIYGIIAYNSRITKREVDFAHQNMIRVVLFGVKSQNSIVDAVEKHPDYIITDNIPKLQQVLY